MNSSIIIGMSELFEAYEEDFVRLSRDISSKLKNVKESSISKHQIYIRQNVDLMREELANTKQLLQELTTTVIYLHSSQITNYYI